MKADNSVLSRATLSDAQLEEAIAATVKYRKVVETIGREANAIYTREQTRLRREIFKSSLEACKSIE